MSWKKVSENWGNRQLRHYHHPRYLTKLDNLSITRQVRLRERISVANAIDAAHWNIFCVNHCIVFGFSAVRCRRGPAPSVPSSRSFPTVCAAPNPTLAGPILRHAQKPTPPPSQQLSLLSADKSEHHTDSTCFSIDSIGKGELFPCSIIPERHLCPWLLYPAHARGGAAARKLCFLLGVGGRVLLLTPVAFTLLLHRITLALYPLYPVSSNTSITPVAQKLFFHHSRQETCGCKCTDTHVCIFAADVQRFKTTLS